MIKRHPKESLANQIAGVLSAAPSQFDPEDEEGDDTRAKLVDFYDENEMNDDGALWKFRKQNIDLLADIDTRYAGKKGGRAKLKEDSLDGISEAEEAESSDCESDDQSREEADSDESISEKEDSASEENDSSFQHMSETNVSEQVKKGLCIRNQLNMWENLLEIRIQMQKCLVAGNKLSQKQHFEDMLICDESGDLNRKMTETKTSFSNLLDKLLLLQDLVIKKYPETRHLGKKAGTRSDEEIPNDTDEEPEEEKPQKAKKMKLNDYESDISNLHRTYTNYRNDTIEKWNSKTRLSVTKNSGQVHSVVSQIEHILNDMDKLHKRTQLKRSEYRILGQDDDKPDVLESNEDNGDMKQIEEYNADIFDDSDFYHQLLRELIEVKSADITDPVQLSRQWIQLQNLRSKMKRKIDTRATKGRKIRYAVHTKLVNFMAPKKKLSWSEEAKDGLYNSLFGKRELR